MNLYLLYKYLLLDFEKQGLTKEQAQQATDLTINQYSSNLFGANGVAFELGKKNLEFFCMYFLQNVFIGEDKAAISHTHKEIWGELQNLILGKEISNKKVYICPRGFGKTTFISQASAIWSACYKYKRYIVLCSAIGDTANEFLNNIKLALDKNERIEQAFGKLYDPKHFTCNSEIIDLSNMTRIKSISANSVFRGKNFGNIRPELVILDDYQKDDEVATHEQREKKWQRFNNDVMKSIQRNTSVVIGCGTIQHKECFYSRLVNDPGWEHRVEKGVLLNDVDEFFNTGIWEEFKKILTSKESDSLVQATDFYYDNEKKMKYPLLWSDFWNCLDYAIDYYSNPISFKQEIQNDVNSIGEKAFKTIVTQSDKEINNHSFEKTILVVDPAGTRTKTTNKDYFAFAVCSTDSNDIKYIRKGEIYKFTKGREYEDYIQHTLDLLKKYDDITHLGVEKNTYGGADVIRLEELISKDIILKNRNIQILNYPQNKNKDDKISTIVGKVNLGQVIFNEEDDEAIQQMMDFAGCKYSLHDDFPDVVAEAVNRIDDITVLRKITFIDKKRLFK